MKTKVYRVVAVIGRKHNVVFESAKFAENDGDADWNAWKDANRARENHCMKLWREGYSVTTDGRYHHIGKNIDGGRIEIFRYTK